MNHLSRQGIIVFLAAVVTTTCMAERSSSSQACTDGDNYFSEILYPAINSDGCGGTDPSLCLPTVCPGIDIVIGRASPFQRQVDFPGNYPVKTPGNPFPRIISTDEIWVDGKKNETLQCFKSKGFNVNIDVLVDGTETGTGVETITTRGHTLLAFFEDVSYVTFKFSGLNTANITVPGLYYMQGGEISRTFSFAQQPYSIVYDITKITGKWIDLCEELKAALEDGGGEEEDTCAVKPENVCKDDVNCKWKRKKSKCVPMPWKN